MPDKPRSNWGPVILLGSLWGFSEAALGMGLRQCASTVSGSVMTGAALLFLAAAWAIKPRSSTVGAMVGIAAFFKLFDALLLGLPLRHGAIGNPIFAIAVEGAAFLLLIAVIRKALAAKPAGQGILGAFSALLAVNLFPLVKYATGVPACVASGTTTPLALYYAPLAVALSFLTVPAGFWLGARIAAFASRAASAGPLRSRWLPSAALALSLAALALLRLA
jgi:hypothetical protein